MADAFLYERVYGYVMDEIRSGALAAGDRVPSEKELADQFGVSRITSKRALRMLAEEGVVVRRRGKGSFVAERAPVPVGGAAAADGPSREQRAGYLALLMPDASESYGLELFRSIEDRAAERGYHLVVRRTRDREELEEQALEALVADQVVDGLIVFPVHGEFYNASLVRLVLDNAPLVLVDRYLRGIPACSVHTDNVDAARTLTDQLLDQGHEHIAFVSPPVVNTSSIEERLDGYELALRERGIPADLVRRFTDVRSTLATTGADGERAADWEAIRAFVADEPRVTAFVACEYDIATLLAEVLESDPELAARRCVVACFDSPSDPPPGRSFLHVRQDQREMGRAAVDLLVAQLNGTTVPLRTVVPFSLMPAVPSASPARPPGPVAALGKSRSAT